MDFELSQDHKVLQAAVRDFVEKEIKPIAVKIDEEHAIPDALVKKMGEMGFLGSYFPEQYGGAGLDMLSYVIVVEEVSKACASSGVLISAHTSLASNPIYAFGTEEQKQKWLPPLNRGELIGCLLLTEPSAGSDAGGIATMYKREGDEFVINGSKIFITNGGYLGTGIVFASFDRSLKHKGISAFIVDLKSPGVVVLKNENKLGIRGTYTTAFALDNLRVPAENLLGKEGKGFNVAMDTLNGGRIGIAAQALGIAEGAFQRALAYSKERKQFDQSHQRVPGDPVQAGRYVRPDRDQQADDLQGGLAERQQDELRHGIGPVQDAGLRGRHLRHQRGDADPRRLRLYLRLRGRADVPRRQDYRDLRGDQRGPADRHLESVALVN